MVRVLGGFEVVVDGRPVPADAWRSRRAADLVKVLALAPSHTLHREQVMELLWPELGAEAAGANLRKAVHYARRAMRADDAIHSEAAVLSLWPGQVDIDADVFGAAAEAALAARDAAACARAAELYHGDPVPGDRYEAWAGEPRQRLRERHLATLKGAGDWPKVVALDPTDEQAHRELMREHLAGGRRREAIRQFERLRDALREYVGVGPDRATIAVYEQVLAAEGEQPPEPAQRAAVLIATGLVQLNRQDFAEAERLARQARDLAVDAGLAHELGDASTLLALVASFTGRWHQVFREEFTASLRHRDELTMAAFDGHLCFAEYHLSGAVPAPDAEKYARELLALADESASKPGRGVARLMLGEALLGAGRYDEARDHLTRALRDNAAAGGTSGCCLSLERLAQLETAAGRPDLAAALLDQGRSTVQDSRLRSHLLVRLLGVAVEAATDPPAARIALTAAERALADTTVVCEPCSINYRVQATITAARTGELLRAGRHLADAERIAGLWQGGRWPAAIWEARAALRRAENQPAQAAAMLHEAASAYAAAGRPADERRCRAAADSMRAGEGAAG